MALLECRQIARFVVGNTINPAAKQDADPFEGKGTDGGVVGRAFGLVALVESAGPEGVGNGAGYPFDEGLTKEFGASPTPVDPVLVAAAFGYWRDACVLLKGSGVCEPVTLLTECSE